MPSTVPFARSARFVGITIALLTGMGTSTFSEPYRVGIAAGPFYIAKRTPSPLNRTTPLLTLEGGRVLSSLSTFKLRANVFWADGLNSDLLAIGELTPWTNLSFTIGSGVTYGQGSGFGGMLTAGVVPQFPLTRQWDLRLEVGGAVSLRNDFGGTGLRATLGVEFAP